MRWLACESQRHFRSSFLDSRPEFDRLSGCLWVFRGNDRFYDLFVSLESGGEVEFFGGFGCGVWLGSVVVPGWVREGLGLS